MAPAGRSGAGIPGRPRRLSFYRRLTRGQKREYDRSDAISAIPLRPGPDLGGAANAVVAALEDGRPAAVARASQALVDRICAGVSRGRSASPRVKVLRTRPRVADGEFHGLYTQTPGGEIEIRVWMLTAAQRQVVKPRTFLRTLLHEVVHHFDMTILDLPSSFHTLGFHARESSLLRALERSGAIIPSTRERPAGKSAARDDRAREAAPAPRAATVRGRKEPPSQLDLFAPE